MLAPATQPFPPLLAREAARLHRRASLTPITPVRRVYASRIKPFSSPSVTP